LCSRRRVSDGRTEEDLPISRHSQGENPAYVQQQLGHSSLRMTLDIYGHYIPKTSTRRGVDVLDEVKKESI